MDPVVNLAEIIYEPLVSTCKTHTFGYGMYGNLKVIIRNDGYVNATKLCTAGGREYSNWSRLDKSKEYIAYLEESLWVPDLGPIKLTECMSFGNTNKINAIVSGTYVHPDMITAIAQWVSSKFAHMVSKIVNNYMVTQYKEEIKKLEQDAIINKHMLAEKDCNITKLMAKIDAMQQQQNDDAIDNKIETQRTRHQLDEVLSNNAELLLNNAELLGHTEEIRNQADTLLHQNHTIMNKLEIAVETRVPPAAKVSTNETLAVFALNPPVDKYTHYISCGQVSTIKSCTSRFGQPVFQIASQPNSKNLFQRIKETPGVVLYRGSNILPISDIATFIQAIKDINDEKYVVDVPKVDPYKTLTVAELKSVCQGRKYKGYTKLNRAGLIQLITDNGGL